MIEATSPAVRSTPKQNEIVKVLRARITGGEYSKSQQLPAQSKLAKDFGVSTVTVQFALQRLTREGFIRAQRPHGTFVVDKPPHLSRYALVFWNDPATHQGNYFWSRYYATLSQEAMRLRREGYDVEIFHGIDEHVDTDDRQRLIRQIESHQLAGLIFCNQPFYLQNTPILDFPGIPRVTFSNSCAFPQVRAVGNDRQMWLHKALDYVLAAGRRRIAILSFASSSESEERVITKALAERGLVVPDYWRQEVNAHAPSAARNCAALLMYAGEKVRPDALLIMDDNLVEEALAGLVAHHVRVPQDVVVVAHANFPWPPARVLPVKRLGYDIRQALVTAINLIDRERRGELVPATTVLPAVFEEEIQISNTTNRAALSSVAVEATMAER